MTTALLTLGVLAVLLATLAVVRATVRLDRLRARTDAAWRALDGALRQRAVAVRELVATGGLPGTPGLDLAAVAGRALAPGPDRETVENELGRMLAALDRSRLDTAAAVGVADAEARLLIARRVYNDAVRDTRALRSRRLVRWLHLAGTAGWPRYFEIVEPAAEAAPRLSPAGLAQVQRCRPIPSTRVPSRSLRPEPPQRRHGRQA